MSDVSRGLACLCCFCGEPGDQQAVYTVDIHVASDSESGTQHMLAHPECLLKHLNPGVPTLIDPDAEPGE